jgi:hypothetical protein
MQQWPDLSASFPCLQDIRADFSDDDDLFPRDNIVIRMTRNVPEYAFLPNAQYLPLSECVMDKQSENDLCSSVGQFLVRSTVGQFLDYTRGHRTQDLVNVYFLNQLSRAYNTTASLYYYDPKACPEHEDHLHDLAVYCLSLKRDPDTPRTICEASGCHSKKTKSAASFIDC